jgi:predicted  nucleic acid-binding Zn-ribbon protein
LERANFELQIDQINKKLFEAEKMNTFYKAEIAKLNEIRSEKEREVESWKNKYLNSEQQRSWELEELRIQFETYKRNVLEKDSQIKWDAERASYETQIMQLRQKVAELDSRVTLLMGENERNNQLANDRLRDIEVLKAKCNSLEAGISVETEELRSQLESYKRANLV